VTGEPRLLFLPGLGADPRLLEPQRRAFPSMVVPEWVPPDPGDTLPQYAARLARTLDLQDGLYLGGVSLGGMLALELARLVKPRAVFLVASCSTGLAVASGLRLLGRTAPFFPSRLLRPRRELAPLVRHMLGCRAPEHVELVFAMRAAIPISFIRWGVTAILRWRGERPPGVPVHHIHGTLDRLIPARRVRPDVLVEGAGHLLNLTHADAVNAFLARHVGAAIRDGG
jgi:pimeloyl-ACP methyl ester carboxylesterase